MMPKCPICGDEFKPTSKHHRIYCSWVCLHTSARRRYRSKPENKAKLAAYERDRRKKIAARKILEPA